MHGNFGVGFKIGKQIDWGFQSQKPATTLVDKRFSRTKKSSLLYESTSTTTLGIVLFKG